VTGRRRPTVWHVALLTPWLLSVAGFHRTFNDNSYLWHVRAGDAQVAASSVLTADPFSFTMAGEPWRTQSWLAELTYHLLDGWRGLEAAPLVTAAMSTLTFTVLALIAYRNSKSLPSTILYLVLSAVIMAGFLNPRPVIISFPLFALVVLADADRRTRWALPLLMWVWASVHGSFFIGLAYLGLRALGRRNPGRQLTRLVPAGAVTLLTAHGWGIVEILGDFYRNQSAVNLMSEWEHPDLLTVPFLPVLILLFGLIWLAGRGGISRRDWLLLVPFLALAFSAARAVPPAWIALAPIATRIVLPVSATATIARPAAALMGAVLVAGPLMIPTRFAVDEDRFPVEAAGHLQAERIFHDDATGGWLVYTQWPHRKIYIDDRAELFGERVRTMVRTRAGEADWEDELDSLGIDEALIRPRTALANLLRFAGWDSVYRDDAFVVLRRPP
jgi:hypothetical protein